MGVVAIVFEDFFFFFFFFAKYISIFVHLITEQFFGLREELYLWLSFGGRWVAWVY